MARKTVKKEPRKTTAKKAETKDKTVRKPTAKKKEAAPAKTLKTTAQFYKDLFDLVPASIIIVDQAGNIVDVNQYHLTAIGRNEITKTDYLKSNIFDNADASNSALHKRYKKVLDGEVLDEEDVFFPETIGGFPGIFHIKAAPIYDEDGDINGAVIIHQNVTEQNIKTKKLEDANVALKILLQQTNTARQEIEERILDNIKVLIMPYMEELDKRLRDAPEITFINAVRENLESITSSFVKNIRSEYLNLTPREIQVANFIRHGKTNREMARLLKLSVRTIEFYRSNLRKKFEIDNRKISLRSYLLVKT